MNPLIILGGIVVLMLIFVWTTYNRLVGLKMRIKEAWSQIDVQLKRRTDLIPNLLETVKGYAKHEKELLENVTKARTALMSAKTPKESGDANNVLTEALGKLFAVAENYPQLKANENFLQLQKELSDTEDKVAYSRQYYNSSITEYNTTIQQFPSNLIAGMFSFKHEEFFSILEEERNVPQVKF
jgi:LemA protein